MNPSQRNRKAEVERELRFAALCIVVMGGLAIAVVMTVVRWGMMR